jgi:hypothetical protein
MNILQRNLLMLNEEWSQFPCPNDSIQKNIGLLSYVKPMARVITYDGLPSTLKN